MGGSEISLQIRQRSASKETNGIKFHRIPDVSVMKETAKSSYFMMTDEHETAVKGSQVFITEE